MHEYSEKYGNLIGLPACPDCAHELTPRDPEEATAVDANRDSFMYGQLRARLAVYCNESSCPRYQEMTQIIRIDRLNHAKNSRKLI